MQDTPPEWLGKALKYVRSCPHVGDCRMYYLLPEDFTNPENICWICKLFWINLAIEPRPRANLEITSLMWASAAQGLLMILREACALSRKMKAKSWCQHPGRVAEDPGPHDRCTQQLITCRIHGDAQN